MTRTSLRRSEGLTRYGGAGAHRMPKEKQRTWRFAWGRRSRLTYFPGDRRTEYLGLMG